MRARVFVAWWLVAVAMAGGGAAGASAATTDPSFDWEKPPAAPSRDRQALTTFKSTRTLAETTRWLKDALERYGKVKPTIYQNEIRDVRFSGCTMELTQRTELAGGIERVTSYSLPLRDVDLALYAVQVFTGEVRFRAVKEFPIVERIIEKGREKSRQSSTQPSIQLLLRNEELIPHRVAWAWIHAARLCGAEVPPPR